jgi:hypothetical protein
LPAALPRPRVISRVTPHDSPYWLYIVYEGVPLTNRQFRRLGFKLRGAVRVAQVIKQDLSDGTLIELELDNSATDEEVVDMLLALMHLLNPLYRSCVVEIHVASKGAVSVALFTVIAMFPPDSPRIMGGSLQVLLEPLGDMVSYLPGLPEAADNVYHVAVQPYQAPKDIGVYLAEALHRIQLDVVGWKQFDVTFGEYLQRLIPARKLN